MYPVEMDRKLMCALAVALALQIIGAAPVMCPNDPNCVCGGTLAVELNCNIDGRMVKINFLPDTYINIICENATGLDYSKLPTCANPMNTFKSVSFKDCPLPESSFKDVLTNIGVNKTMALIFQNAKNLSGFFDRKHFSGLQDLTKLLLSVNGVSRLPDNLFVDINNLTWLNIRSNTINLSEELFKPLEKLETLEISHNHMTNISSNLFSHLSYLRKLSLWQSNVTWFSKDLFTGVDVLEELDLSSNGLNELPASIFKPLKKLKKLTLFANKFSSLPQNLFKHNKELETVVILNNDAKLIELPKYLFGDMANLKQIYVQRSGIEKLPYDVFADSPQITNISLAFNDLKTLPESIFNNQINLLELDLSHNKLSSLEPKLFSSLVRLQRLNLNHNELEHVDGTTFSPLLSLIYLDMEHNNLKTISSHLFNDNRQRMYISLAYNKLSFEEKEMLNNSWVVKKISPFTQTYSLMLLNLSHNNFKIGFEDWWVNGHAELDISFNSIEHLWPLEANETYNKLMRRPVHNIWISNNPMKCECSNYKFIDYMTDNFKTEISDKSQVQCPLWAREVCYVRFTIFTSVAIVAITSYTIMVIIFLIYRKLTPKKSYEYKPHSPTHPRRRFFDHLKKNQNLKPEERSNLTHYYDKYGNPALLLDYHNKDEKFIHEQLMAGFKLYALRNGPPKPKNMFTMPDKEKILNWFAGCKREEPKYMVIILFTPNYLMSQYKNVDIKKIHSEMTEDVNAVYIFLDDESEPVNSVYTFLKDQRSPYNSLVWKEPNFWEKISEMVDIDRIVELYANYQKMMKNLDEELGQESTVDEIREKATVADHLSLLQCKV